MQMCCLLCRCRCRSIKASEFSMFIFRNKILRLRCFRSADKCAFAVLCVMTVAMYYVFVRLVFFFFLEEATSFWVERLYESCVEISRFCFYLFRFVALMLFQILRVHVSALSLPLMDTVALLDTISVVCLHWASIYCWGTPREVPFALSL